MKLPQNSTTFLKSLPLKKMKGEDVLVAIAFFLCGGNVKIELENKAIKKNWSKVVIGKKYNPAFSNRAKGKIHPTGSGKFFLTDEGTSYIQELIGDTPVHLTTLLVFKHGNAHTFDKFIRGVLKTAQMSVDIADTYVAGNVFDTLLDEIPITTPVRFVYGNDVGGFLARATRFSLQYKIKIKESKKFHDRFIIVDGKAYIIGPSLKDAADKKPATVTAFNMLDSKKLVDLFENIWKEAK